MFGTRLALAATLALMTGAPAAAQTPTMQIVVYSFGFTPKPIRLAAGRPVTLTFVNTSGGGHDFTAQSFFASSRITAGAAPDGEIELKPHETRSITLIPQAGTYNVHCSHFMHSTMGMHDQITVS